MAKVQSQAEIMAGGNNLNSYMQPAQKTLEDMIKLFRQGGGYGAGQNALIDEQANQTQAKAASDAVASGMSSGSLAASTGARIASDTAKAKLGVEDTRTNLLAQAMQALSSMFTQFGGMNSQERMQTESLKKQGAIADMNAGVTLMGRSNPQPRGVGVPGFASPWDSKQPGYLTDSQWASSNQPGGYNSPQF